MFAFAGCKAYMPAFWSLPNLFLVNAAAAGSIGLINSLGNLGGYFGPSVMGYLRHTTNSYSVSFWILSGSMMVTVDHHLQPGPGSRIKKT